MRADAQAIVDDWIDATQGKLLGEMPPEYVRIAAEQAAADREIEGQHWLDATVADVERIIAASSQLELKLPKMTQRALARQRFARMWEAVVAPFACTRKEATVHEKMKICRREARVSVLRDGKLMLQWDEKAGQPLYDPDDAREEAMRLARRQIPVLMELLERPGYRAYYLCGTAPNSPRGELAKGQRALFAKWYRLIRGCKRKRSPLFPIVGAVTVMESPLGRFGDWHPHLNAIVVCDRWLDFKALKQWWHWNIEMVPIEGHQSSIEKAFREIIKYSCRTVSEKSLAKQQSHAADEGPDCVPRAPVRSAAAGVDRRDDGPAADPLSARETARRLSGDTCGVGRDEREAPNSQTGKAPAMEDWGAMAILEFHRAHQRFRRTRAYRALYGIPKPAPVDRTGQRHIGRVRWNGRGFDPSFALLESIPGDKSTPENIRASYLDEWTKLLGPPGILARAQEAARMIQNAFGPVSLAL